MEQLGLMTLPPDYRPRYNIAPSQPILAARDSDEGRKAAFLKWGLIPYWAKDPKMAYKMINARSETVSERPAFRAAFERRRCIIPADGFYEWRKSGGKKLPVRFRLRDGGVFAFAGLWESWRPPQSDERIYTCTILTTSANEVVQPVHDRMPVILDRDDIDLWLDQSVPGGGVRHLLKPYDAEKMDVYPVSTRVNSPYHDDPACIEPVVDIEPMPDEEGLLHQPEK